MPIRNVKEFKEYVIWYWTNKYVKMGLLIALILFIIGTIEIIVFGCG